MSNDRSCVRDISGLLQNSAFVVVVCSASQALYKAAYGMAALHSPAITSGHWPHTFDNWHSTNNVAITDHSR